MTDYKTFIPSSGFFGAQKARAQEAIDSFSPAEKGVFWFFMSVFLGSTLFILFQVNQFLLVQVPREGGSLTEGVLGSPRFINPVLAVSDADRDLSSLIYSGLMKATPEGILIPDLAESYSISEDGLVYTFVLRENIAFHDGTPVTTDDIIFTIAKTQDPALKSPRRASWDGVLVQKIDERMVEFILTEPYSPFLENTILGILPEHIWNEVSAEQFPFSQFNIEPVGTGPYQMERIKRNASGLPEFYELSSFSGYALGRPFISTLKLVFYVSEDDLLEAYKSEDIESVNSLSPHDVRDLERDGARVERAPLPRIFAVFFNQNQSVIFTNKVVREALDIALDRTRIVSEVLGGYGTPLQGPIPPNIMSDLAVTSTSDEPSDVRKEIARVMLADAGWTLNEEGVLARETDEGIERLVFSLSTSNTEELKVAAQIIKEEWEAIGVQVNLKIFEIGDLHQNIIRPRQYDSLLFGEIIGRELDLFSFWHSSQRNDPGLNVALYANITVDKLLEDARGTVDRETRLESYIEFQKEIAKDTPAVFIYTPDFVYLVPDALNKLKLGSITTSGERFLNIHEWYVEEEKVWKFFKHSK